MKTTTDKQTYKSHLTQQLHLTQECLCFHRPGKRGYETGLLRGSGESQYSDTILCITFMKNINYRVKGYRLSDKTIKNLAEISFKEKLSYNLLFSRLINIYNKEK